MSAINDLREALNEILGENYYFDEAPKDAEYPYRVGSIESSFDDEVAEVFTLAFDYWGSGKEPTAIYDLADADAGNGDRSAPTGLNGIRIQLANGYADMFKLNTTPVPDTDKRIRHIRVKYETRLYYE